MTDANGSKSNASGRRARRSARLTAGYEGSKTGAAKGKGGEGKSFSDQKSPVGRRSRRRRPMGRQVAGGAGTSDKLLNSAGVSRGNRTTGLANQTPLDNRQDAGVSNKTSALKAVPPSRLLTSGSSSVGGKRSFSGRATVSRSASSKSATAGSVPLSSSLVRRRSRRPKLPKYAISAIWILVGGIGLATIFGTILGNRPGGEPTAALTESAIAPERTKAVKFPIPLGQEIPELKAELEGLPALYPKLQFKSFYVDVDTGDYVDVSGREAIAAASTIKLPILLAFFEEVDKGNIELNQTVALLPDQVADGSGEMQMSPPGTQFTALEVATRMIVNSDNTATNMMIDLLGGAEVLNARFAKYGLEETRLNNPLPDVEGTNVTSARDLVHSMLLVQGDTLEMRSRDYVLNILNRTENKRLLAFGLTEKEALTYNKTGFISQMLGDVAMVDLSNGKRYIVAALVERPDNDGRALELIHSISGRTYQYTDRVVQPAVTPLGNPDGSGLEAAPAGEPATSLPSTDESPSTSTIKITKPAREAVPPPEDVEPAIEEDPYPSANPE